MAEGEIDFLTLTLAKSYAKRIVKGTSLGLLNKRVYFSSADWTLISPDKYSLNIQHDLNTTIVIATVCDLSESDITTGIQRFSNYITLTYPEPFDGYVIINYESSNTGGGGGFTDLSAFDTDDLQESASRKYLTPTQISNWDNHMINKNNPHEVDLSQLKNVVITTPANNQGLFYDSVTGKWKNKTVSTSDEKVKMSPTDTNGDYLINLIDGITLVEVNGKLRVKTLDGLLSTIEELNSLIGMNENVRHLFDSMINGMTYTGIVNTKAELVALTGMSNGDLKIVLVDESQANKRMTYIYSGNTSTWDPIGEAGISIRNFLVDPIKLGGSDKEIVGVLDQANMDLTGIARTSDLNGYTTRVYVDDNFAKKTDLSGKVNTSDIVDSLTSMDATVPLSANQGPAIKQLIDNKSKVEPSAIPGNIKIDGLETHVFTQIQTDWNQTDNTKVDFIRNKPTIVVINDNAAPTVTTETYSALKIVTLVDSKSKVTSSSINGNIRVDNVELSVFTQTQSDWNQSDNTKADYIKNKPVINAIDDTLVNSLTATYSITKIRALVDTKSKVEASSNLGFIKIDGTETKVFEQSQSDWNQSDNTKADYIKNKPTLLSINDSSTTSTTETYSVFKIIESLDTKQNKISYTSVAPATPSLNDLWLDISNATQYILKSYDGTTWVQVGSSGGSGGSQIIVDTVAPTDTTKLWLDNTLVASPILKWYDSTTWMAVGTATNLTNQGTGIGVYSQTLNGTIELRSIRAGNLVQVVQSGNEIVISANVNGEANAVVDYSTANAGLFTYNTTYVAFDATNVKLKAADAIDATTKLIMHMDESSFKDEMGHTVTNNGATVSTIRKVFGTGSAQLNGTSSYITVADPAGDFNFLSSAFTIKCRVYFSTSIPTDKFHILSCGTNLAGWYLMLNNTVAGAVSFHTNNGTVVLTGNASIATADRWYEICFVKNGTAVYLFIDGTLDKSGTYGSPIQTTSNNDLWIGTGNYSSHPYMTGFVEEVLIWKKAMHTTAYTLYTVAYGTNYPTTAYSVITKAAQLFDAKRYFQINSVNISEYVPTGTSTKYALDVGATYPKVWSSASGTWIDCTDVTTSGMTSAAFMSAMANLSWSQAWTKFGISLALQTTNTSLTPTVDKIDINYIATPNNLNGHIVMDTNNVGYTQRANLKFIGNVNISDNAVSDYTQISIPIPSFLHANATASQSSLTAGTGVIQYTNTVTKRGTSISMNGTGTITLASASTYEIIATVGTVTASGADSKLVCKLQSSTNNSTFTDLPNSTYCEYIGPSSPSNNPPSSSFAYGTITTAGVIYIRLLVVTNTNISSVGGTVMPMISVRELL